MLLLTLAVIICGGLGYELGRRRARALVGGVKGIPSLHSLPRYHGLYVLLWSVLPVAIVILLWNIVAPGIISSILIEKLPADLQQLPAAQLGLVLNDVTNLAEGNIVSGDVDGNLQSAAEQYLEIKLTSKRMLWALALVLSVACSVFALAKLAPKFRARNRVEIILRSVLFCCSGVAILTTIGIIFSVLFESLRFFGMVPIHEFLFGLEWSPQTAMRVDQVGGSGAFGAIPLFVGTLLISLIAMFVAVPVGLLAAIYLSEFASRRVRNFAKPVLEILAGIPTVVYGFFAALTVAPMIRDSGTFLGLDVSSESALAAGLVMGIMIIPFVSSLSDDVIKAVPQALRDASAGLGATQAETITMVVIPAALPGIVASVLLAASRALGETMIVVMSAGMAANLTMNPLESVTTVTVQIVTLLTGDQEFDSAKTLAAFALGLGLFVVTLVMNIIALRFVQKYREQYD